MAATRTAHTVWNGDLFEGSGNTTLDSSGLGTFDVTWKARTEAVRRQDQPRRADRRSPLGLLLHGVQPRAAQAGHTPEEVHTKADVTFVPGTGITGSHLTVSARIPGISEEEFQKIAGEAKVGCPVSGALASIEITLDATLAAS